MSEVWGPSATWSSTAEKVTVWATLQFPVVKAKVVRAPVPWPTFPCGSGSTVTVTAAVGWLPSRTVQVSVTPPSVAAVLPADWVTTMPGTSLSVTVAVTDETATAL